MYLSLEWLKDFVTISKNLKPNELGDKMTVHTVEIDGVESQAGKYKGVVVGKILEINKHPKADKLQLAVVDVGEEKLNIVCGAPNIKVGQIVPVALLGAVLLNGMEIKPVSIRGEESYGMMCAEDELGLGEDHSGIMILDESAEIGLALADYLKLNDVIFEVDNKSITNRPDLWSHHGMAREIATFLNTEIIKDLNILKKEDIKIDEETIDLKVKIEDKIECQRYMAVAVKDVNIEASPKWMQTRLISVGIKPINNIVDISNYVMLELGQPMHAFDAKKTTTKKENKIKISVRKAKKDEILKSLDAETRSLDIDDLVIANDKEAIALAGLMGGENSEIDSTSETIIFESANFNGKTIRKTSQRLALRTEASQRFEKMLDPSLCEPAIVRAVELVKQLCPKAKISSQIIDENNFSYIPNEISLDILWLENYLGQKIPNEEILVIMENLGFEPQIEKETLKIKTPSWRATKDVSTKEDIVEEIARIYGYDKIEAKMPKIFMQAPLIDPERALLKKIRKIMSLSLAMFEVSNYSFVGEDQLKVLGVDDSSYIKLANPISKNHTMLRQSLATNIFENVKKNQAKYDDIRIFEIGNVYLNIEGNLKKSDKDENTLPLQEKRLGILLAANKQENYLNMKSAIDYLIAELNIDELQFSRKDKMYYWSNEKYVTEIKCGQTVVGVINQLQDRLAKKMGIKREVIVAEIYIKELLKISKTKGAIIYKSPGRYPSLERDLAFILNESVSYNNIKTEIEDFHDYICDVKLFDEYHGDKIGDTKKSLAFHVSYQAEKTLEAKEVDAIQKKLLKHCEQKFDAKIRDF